MILPGDAVKGTKLHVFRGKKRKNKERKRLEGGRRSVEEGTVGHVGYILALAVSSDGTYLVSHRIGQHSLFH